MISSSRWFSMVEANTLNSAVWLPCQQLNHHETPPFSVYQNFQIQCLPRDNLLGNCRYYYLPQITTGITWAEGSWPCLTKNIRASMRMPPLTYSPLFCLTLVQHGHYNVLWPCRWAIMPIPQGELVGVHTVSVYIPRKQRDREVELLVHVRQYVHSSSLLWTTFISRNND